MKLSGSAVHGFIAVHLALSSLLMVGRAQARVNSAPPTDLQLICEQTGDSFEGGWKDVLAQVLRTGTAEQIYTAFASYSHGDADEFYRAPWLMSMSNRIEARRAAYQIQLKHAGEWLSLPANQVKSYLKGFTDKEATYTPDVSQAADYAIHILKPHRDVGEAMKIVPAICLSYPVMSCSSATKRALTLMQPYEGVKTSVSLIDVTREILTDASYVRPLAIASLKMMDRVQLAENGVISPGKFFSDIEAAFLEVGNTPEIALEKTWKVIGFYSTRGSSMDYVMLENFKTDENAPVLISFFVISSAMNYLDLLYIEEPGFYSYPNSVKMLCPFGKPYHFWNPAYLSRRLSLEGQPLDASALAMYLSGELYEIFANGYTYGRHPLEAFRQSLFSVHNNDTRMNLLFNTLGAVYGVKPEMPQNGDAALQALLNHAVDLGPMSPSQLAALNRSTVKYYTSWRKMLAPDSVFNALWLP